MSTYWIGGVIIYLVIGVIYQRQFWRIFYFGQYGKYYPSKGVGLWRFFDVIFWPISFTWRLFSPSNTVWGTLEVFIKNTLHWIFLGDR